MASGDTRPPEVIDLERQLAKFTARGVRLLTTRLVRELKEATPVLTFYASANWMATLKVPFQGLNGRRVDVFASDFDRESPGRSRRIESVFNSQLEWFAAQEAALQATMSYTVKTGGPVYVVNNTDYIGLLDEGTSDQAEPGFIGDTLRAVIQSVEVSGARNIRKGFKPTGGSDANASRGIPFDIGEDFSAFSSDDFDI